MAPDPPHIPIPHFVDPLEGMSFLSCDCGGDRLKAAEELLRQSLKTGSDDRWLARVRAFLKERDG